MAAADADRELELFEADALGADLLDELVLFLADDFEAELLDDELLEAEPLELFEDDALAECEDRLRDLRAVRTGRFQPTALSARNVTGIEMTFSGLSTTEATAASAC